MTGVSAEKRDVFAPGRVNLIGDHTDYTGGLVFPMAINRGVRITGEVGGHWVEARSDREPVAAHFSVPVTDPAGIEPRWARHLAGVAAEMGTAVGFTGQLSSDLPVAGLSSSAAVQVAAALMLGHEGSPLERAMLCQAAEHRATGVPCGIMDQLTIASGIPGHALLIDCHTLEITPHLVPDDVEIVIVHSGQHRELVDSEYATRRAQCEAAEEVIGPLRIASLDAVEDLDDPVLRARARHVVTENERVAIFAKALATGDYAEAGQQMLDSHRSLGHDFEVSTSVLDALVDELSTVPGVYGARLTGAGFGGAVVALTRPGALDRGFVATASAGASVL